MMDFPGTKFIVPRLRAGTLKRLELVEALVRHVLTVPLTVVYGPAGYGKTTLVAMVADEPEIGECRWISVDPDDNDPRRFLAGLGAALGPSVNAASGAVLAEGGAPDVVRRASTALINAVVATTGELVVVLDEWETITAPTVDSLLEQLVERAPANMHFVVTTRDATRLPLARLRARGMLGECGPEALRFTRAEAEALLNGTLQLGLSDSDVTRMHARTEGWAAGVRLLASARDRGPATTPPRAGEASMFEFLADEVFDAQPPDVQTILLETSVLSTLSGPACAAVTGRDDAIDVVAQRGLFLTEQGDHGTYRYHQLLTEFLHGKLARWPAAARIDLYRRAARAEDDPLAVVRHLLDAGDHDAAAEALANAGAAQLRLGRAASLRDLLDRTPAELLAKPELCVLAGDLALDSGELERARRAYELAGTSGAVVARLADCLVLLGRVSDADELIERALADPLEANVRVRLLLTRARVAQISGQYDLAEESLRGGVDAALDFDLASAAAAHLSPTLGLIRGGVDQLERFAGFARVDGLARLNVDAIAATVDLIRGRLDEARNTAERVLADYDNFGGAPPLLGFAVAGARLLATGPSNVPLDPAIDALLTYADLLTGASFLYANTWFMIGRARWQRGSIDDARTALTRMAAAPDAPPGSAPLIAVNRSSLDGLIALAEGDHRRAEDRLRVAVTAADQSRLVDIYGSARIRLAYLYTELGRPDAAMRIAEPALVECERSGLSGRILVEGRAAVPVLRLFAGRSRYAAGLLRVLDDIAAPQATPVPGGTETLTPREVEVLRQLADGSTNREIAQRLVLGEETVKTHVGRVLRKLGVRSRTAAVARARDIGITN